MVCGKCQKLQKSTQLATPGVKRKNDIYYGSPLGTSTKASDRGKSASATIGNNGIGKNKLLSKSAKNPYAAYSSSCSTCKTKTDQGSKFCHKCAYKANACAMCGKGLTKDNTSAANPIVQGQRFSAK
ncbi:MAG: hypothetical protein M1829_001924 [Trizodia sp. TS-e1964]|nr:MAG: hypothetical protein M1829_001924 [Trizodia sp. TS-e1964]